MKVPRSPWRSDFPPVILHTTVKIRNAHPGYAAAKCGDATAALILSRDLMPKSALRMLQGMVTRSSRPILLPVHAEERDGYNAIPLGMARWLAFHLDCGVALDVVQLNKVSHTRADGFHRLAHQPLFGGSIDPHADYVLVDDHFGMGGTLANLRGFVLAAGAKVIGSTTLTASRGNAILALSPVTQSELAVRHGQDLESYLRSEFDFGFECLTEPEAGYLNRVSTVDAIRTRIAAAKSADG
jgi:hypothetical protein